MSSPDTFPAELLDRHATDLVRAEQTGTTIAPISETTPGLDLTAAYAVQQRVIATRLATGATVVGHKVGLTAAVMQQLLGVDQPDFGALLDDMVHPSESALATDRFCAPRVEPEICFRLGAALRGPGITAADVLAATESVAPALEIVDSRIADWRITIVDTVADNASSAAVVLGGWTPLADAPELSTLTVDLVVDGETNATGSGAAVLGHPAVAVAWLANTLAEFDTGIDAGQIVLPGAMTTAPFVTAGQTVKARFEGLGAVSVSFT